MLTCHPIQSWHSTKTLRPPTPGEVLVWYLHHPDPVPSLSTSFLNLNESKKAHEFNSKELQNHYTLRHIALRLLLSQSIKLPPSQIAIITNKFGKPFCPTNHAPVPPCYFNLTHRQNQTLVAITNQAELGIDIEYYQPGIAQEIATHAFTENEQQIIATAKDPDHQTIQFWVRKEAYLKARGLGLSIEPNSIDVSDISIPLAPQAYQIIDLPNPDQNIAAALCIQGNNPPAKITLCKFPLDALFQEG